MSVTGDPHMPGNCWCGRAHVLVDASQPFNLDFPETYRPSPATLGGLGLTEARVRQIVREELALVASEGEAKSHE